MTYLADFLTPSVGARLDANELSDFGSILRLRAEREPDRCALLYLADGESEASVATYGELDRKARAIAAELQQRELGGQRALLLFPPGLDFVSAFFGCLYAGTIPVPSPPPRARRGNERLESMLDDCGVKACLSAQSFVQKSQAAFNACATLSELQMILADDIDLEQSTAWEPTTIDTADLAFLQYTSGSTGTAKGVMVSHGNLLNNSSTIAEAFACCESDVAISWLPNFHDMGLIGGILLPVYLGRPTILAPPVSFIEKPLRWLQAITRYGATISGGPNFAYDVCIRKISDEEIEQLDLSRWRVAFTGSETIRPETLDRFAERFAACGFRREAFYPCYGLAEATLMATGGVADEAPIVYEFDVAALEAHHVVEANGKKAGRVVSCGRALPEHRAVIVDPQTRLPRSDAQVGEIWLAGPSVAQGYWNRQDETEEVFRAELGDRNGAASHPDGPFLRTGDLGFAKDGEIFITGRLKDMIIVRGVNHYPHDIERAVENCHPLVRHNGVAAFSVDGEHGEQLVLVLEIVRPTSDDALSELFATMRREIAEQHELLLHAATVLKPGHLPRTTSGKIQRKACRVAFLSDNFHDAIATWRSQPDAAANSHAAAGSDEENGSGRTAPPSVVVSAPLQQAGSPLQSGNGSRIATNARHPSSALPTRSQPQIDSVRQKQVGEALAVVGMSCRFPGARNVREFRKLLRSGGDAIDVIPPERWDVDDYYDPDPEVPGKMISRWGGFLKDIDLFDANLFGVTPREATRMDPQQRLLVEQCWDLFENAGISPNDIAGSSTGCFIGIGGTDYSTMQLQYEFHLEGIDAYTGTGNAHSLAANRLSYLFDMGGPSLAVDTACSSSLVAFHYAVQSLRNGECDAAVVGGVNVILTPEVTIAFSKARMLSPDGRCMAFDERANGYVRGEGCGLVLLKRLKDAEAAGDNILGVVRGSACNQDGRTTGVSAPNPDAQEAVIRAALQNGGLNPDHVGYVEAHGTGTPIGDPIEVESLRRVFTAKQNDADALPCLFGSVKGNIGHLETASGVAGLIKVLLMLQDGDIYRQVNWRKMNPHIKLEGSRLQLAVEPTKWHDTERRRVAGINSFGFGGTNAHIVLEAPAATKPSSKQTSRRGTYRAARPQHLLVLSAHRDSALKSMAEAYAKLLSRSTARELPDICFSAATTRAKLTHRLIVHGSNGHDMAATLKAASDGTKNSHIATGHARRAKHGSLAFLCTGQGAQYAGMGRRLYDSEPIFRRCIDQCDELLRPQLDVPLLTTLYGDRKDSPIDETAYTQPALFAVEWALARLWQSWGLQPDAVLGHSIGEYVAAALAGVFSWEDGLLLIARRGCLMQSLPDDGAMGILLASEEQCRALVAGYHGEVAIAALNGPRTVVISGRSEAVQACLQQAEASEMPSRLLNVSHAFHSPLMDPILDEFERFAQGFQYRPPQLPLVSNVTGRLFGEDEIPDAEYWRRHIRNTVRFEAGMQALAEFGCDRFLEVGPTPTLSNMGRTCLPPGSAAWFTSLRRDRDDWDQMLHNLGTLWCQGITIDWRAFHNSNRCKRVALPSYPYERERFWITPDTEGVPAARHIDASAHPLLGGSLSSPMESKQYESIVDTRRLRFLDDHRVHGSVLVPAAAYLEMALAAAKQAADAAGQTTKQPDDKPDPARSTLLVENITFQQPLFLADNAAALVQLIQQPGAGDRSAFQIHSCSAHEAAGWTLNVAGTYGHAVADQRCAKMNLEDLQNRCSQQIPVEPFYEELARRGLQYGPQFQNVKRLLRGELESVGLVEAPDAIKAKLDKYVLHPALLDASFHVLAAAMPESLDDGETYLPVGVESIHCYGSTPAKFWVHALWKGEADDSDEDTGEVCGDVMLFDEEGTTLAEIRGLRLKCLAAPGGGGGPSSNWQDWLYRLSWKPLEPLTEIAPGTPTPQHLSNGMWLVLADSKGFGSALVERFRQHEVSCALVTIGDETKFLADKHIQCNPLNVAELWEVIKQSPLAGETIGGIVHLWSLDVDDFEGDSVEQIERARCLSIESFAEVTRHLAAQPTQHRPSILTLTRGSQAINQEPSEVSVAQTSVWGLARVNFREHKDIRTTVTDLCPITRLSEQADQFWLEIWHDAYDNQAALRDGTRWGLRLQRYDVDLLESPATSQQAQIETLLKGNQPFRLEVSQANTIDGLTVRPTRRHQLESDQVELQVAAAGLNFSDVLKALGLYPGITDAVVPLGIECAGTVTAVGSDVSGIAPGDEVIALAPFSFGRYAVTVDYGIMKKPANLSFAQAAAMPVAYITAYYALQTLGQLAKGERVLIHAAAGGVGQAAIQIAQAAGAEIFATAGTPEKREFLKQQGVHHVFDSRTLDFFDEIMQVTGGQGVDVVLNSLAGDAIPKSLSLLRAYGRFLEIGKIDIYQNRMLGLSPFRDNLSYHAIDMDRLFRQRPDMIRQLLGELLPKIESGDYGPLPVTEFGMGGVADAFRYMAQRKNIGKIVVAIRDATSATSTEDDQAGKAEPPGKIHAGCSYLITGGMGDLGLNVAEHFAAAGATHLALLGRSEPGERASTVIQRLSQQGVTVKAIRCDVSDAGEVRAALDEIKSSLPPVRGILHAAGVLDDSLILNLTSESLQRVLAPKIAGAWNLHQASHEMQLDMFVMFSSVASVLGAEGQGNYACGNAFLDAMASLRHHQGLPATTINWGPWLSSGMAGTKERRRGLERRGIFALPVDTALMIMDQLIRQPLPQVMVANIDWARGLRHDTEFPPMISDLAESEGILAAAGTDAALLERLRAAAPHESEPLLTSYFVETLGRVTGQEPDQIDATEPIRNLGLDSLMAIELKNAIESSMRISIPMAALFQDPSIEQLAGIAYKIWSGQKVELDEPPEMAAAAEANLNKASGYGAAQNGDEDGANDKKQSVAAAASPTADTPDKAAGTASWDDGLPTMNDRL